MKYLQLVCWDAERMNGQTEPEPGATATEDEEGFPVGGRPPTRNG